MDLPVIVPAQLLLFLQVPAPHRLLDVPCAVFAADHEADLARRVGGDGGVGVLDDREYFETGLFKGSD